MAIVHLTGIGDVVHGLPVACDLKRAYPDRPVLWIAEPAPADVVRCHPAVDDLVVFHKRRGVRGVLDLRRDLRSRPARITLNMQRYFKSAFPTLFSGADIRVGLPPSKTRDGIRFLHTHHLPEQPWCHTQDLLLEFRPLLGLPEDAPVEWRISFTERERLDQRSFFEALTDGRPVAGVVLASANAAKDWPAPRYVELVDALTGELGYRVVLVGGPGHRERERANSILRDAAHPVVDALGDSVRRVMWLVDGVDLLVSPDTGPLHLAHALATPVVGLYGHTNPARVGPWHRYRELVVDAYTPNGAAPDPTAYEPKAGRMETISCADVVERVETARSRYGAGTRRPLREGPEGVDTAVEPRREPGGRSTRSAGVTPGREVAR